MTYKTILVHVDEARNAEARIALAANMAIRNEAHLIGCAFTGVSRFLYASLATGTDGTAMGEYLKTLQENADRALSGFEEMVKRLGVLSFEARKDMDEPGAGLSLQARYSDLVVLGQYDPDGRTASTNADLPEYVAMNGGSPVLTVPYALSPPSSGDRVLVAWNASLEAKRAIHYALPLLRRAALVDVIVFNPDPMRDLPGDNPGTDIAAYLSRHRIKVNVSEQRAEGDVGDALLSLAADLGSDLLVMGCYGHARFREIFLGGATRTVLQTMTVPVLMAH